MRSEAQQVFEAADPLRRRHPIGPLLLMVLFPIVVPRPLGDVESEGDDVVDEGGVGVNGLRNLKRIGRILDDKRAQEEGVGDVVTQLAHHQDNSGGFQSHLRGACFQVVVVQNLARG